VPAEKIRRSRQQDRILREDYHVFLYVSNILRDQYQ
jgi:hypothetical protein